MLLIKLNLHLYGRVYQLNSFCEVSACVVTADMSAMNISHIRYNAVFLFFFYCFSYDWLLNMYSRDLCLINQAMAVDINVIS